MSYPVFCFVLVIEPVYSIYGRKDNGMIWNDLLIELQSSVCILEVEYE